MKHKLLLILFLILIVGRLAMATPSTQIWNPSTDIQPYTTTHLGIDNYFNPLQTNYPIDYGVTYGLMPNLEIGIDAFYPQNSPLVFNMKYGIKEGDLLPAMALGIYGVGTKVGVTDQNVVYALLAKTIYINQFSIGRLTGGYFVGNRQILLNPEGAQDNNGVILTWDKSVTDQLWLCVDYSSTRSAIGTFFYGFSWSFTPSIGVLCGYGTYNNGSDQVYTTQLDINL